MGLECNVTFSCSQVTHIWLQWYIQALSLAIGRTKYDSKCPSGLIDTLEEQGELGVVGDCHVLEARIEMALGTGRLVILLVNFEQHEAAVVRETMGGEGSYCERYAAEGFDGVGVELTRWDRLAC